MLKHLLSILICSFGIWSVAQTPNEGVRPIVEQKILLRCKQTANPGRINRAPALPLYALYSNGIFYVDICGNNAAVYRLCITSADSYDEYCFSAEELNTGVPVELNEGDTIELISNDGMEFVGFY